MAKYIKTEEGYKTLCELDADDTEIAMLIEVDLLPAIHDPNGKILTDSSGNVILRY